MSSSLKGTISSSALTPVKMKEIYILVMGLTGAGKSTFISIVTGDNSIPIGNPDDMDGITQVVADYPFTYVSGETEYIVHLLDTPGFDDGTANDAEVLARIANYANTIFRFGSTIAGVLYLHDITKQKMGGVGIRNLRMLEKMIGVDKWDNCTLVTTKWGCTTDLGGEEAWEAKLKTDEKYFKAMIEGSNHARMARFERTKLSALQIIKPHLRRGFSPAICQQMVDPKGPRSKLIDTDAGKVVAEHLRQLEAANIEVEKTKAQIRVLEQEFDEKLFLEFKAKRDTLRRNEKLHRVGRWFTRSVIIGGCIVATVFTAGPGAGTFVVLPAFEKVARVQKRSERQEFEKLRDDYTEKSTKSTKLSALGSRWLEDKSVTTLKDLDAEKYSIKSSSSTELDHRPKTNGKKKDNRADSELEQDGTVDSSESSLVTGYTSE